MRDNTPAAQVLTQLPAWVAASASTGLVIGGGGGVGITRGVCGVGSGRGGTSASLPFALQVARRTVSVLASSAESAAASCDGVRAVYAATATHYAEETCRVTVALSVAALGNHEYVSTLDPPRCAWLCRASQFASPGLRACGAVCSVAPRAAAPWLSLL